MPGPCSKPVGGKSAHDRQHPPGEPAVVSKKLAARIADWQNVTAGKLSPKTQHIKPGSQRK